MYQKILFFTTSICLILVNISILVLAGLLFLKTDINKLLLSDITDNYKSSMINDFKIDRKCKNDNFMLSNGYYQGTVNGCMCPFGLRRGSCDDSRDVMCYNVHQTNRVNFDKWRNNTLCIVRENEIYQASVSYSDLWELAVPKGQKCKKGYKECGYLDTTYNIMCIDSFSSCPITKVEFNSEPFFKNSTISKDKIKSIKLNDIYFVYTNEPEESSNIPVEFKVYEKMKCAYPDEVYKDSKGVYKLDDYSDYFYVTRCSRTYSQRIHYNQTLSPKDNDLDSKLIEVESNFTGYRVDYRFDLIDEITKIAYFRDNKILTVVSELPKYPVKELEDININLFTRTYLGISKSCDSNLANPTLFNNFIEINEKVFLKVLVTISLSVGIFLFTFVTLCQYDSILKYSFLLALTLGLVFFTYYYLHIFVLNSLDESFTNCVDNLTAEIIGIIEENNEELNVYIYRIQFCLIVFVFLIISFTIILFAIGEEGRRLISTNGDKPYDDRVKVEDSYTKLKDREEEYVNESNKDIYKKLIETN